MEHTAASGHDEATENIGRPVAMGGKGVGLGRENISGRG